MAKQRPKKENKTELARPPIVVILGHIDHGKTTLLDTIRKTRIAAKEVGGITQRIGAYQVEVGKRKITFIDTPGHEAFSKMRERGAQVADLAVLVVAADEGVKPQTVEAIAHAKAAGIPIIVALNKIDLATPANVTRVKGQLAKEGLVAEKQGGQVPFVSISAKTGQGISELLEMIGLVADLGAVAPASSGAPLEAVVVESLLSPTQGPLATAIVRRGTLNVGDRVFAGEIEGKVKALFNDQGQRFNAAGPGTPVQILGFSGTPSVGEVVTKEPTQKVTKPVGGLPPPALGVAEAEAKLTVILRADTLGSLEAISLVLTTLEIQGKKIDLILKGIGPILDSDIRLASSTKGVILGFNVPLSTSTKKLADDLGVGTRTFSVIYELIEVAQKLLAGAKALEEEEKEPAAEVLKTFTLHSGDLVAGVKVLRGKIKYKDRIKVLRGEEEVHQGKVRGLKVGKETVSEIRGGQEAGLLIKPLFEFKKGDQIVVS